MCLWDAPRLTYCSTLFVKIPGNLTAFANLFGMQKTIDLTNSKDSIIMPVPAYICYQLLYSLILNRRIHNSLNLPVSHVTEGGQKVSSASKKKKVLFYFTFIACLSHEQDQGGSQQGV